MAGTKLTKAEVQKRVDKCLELRFYPTSGTPILQKQWIAYCHEHYGDKSEQQYHKYWMDAKEQYEENWKAKLQKMLDPAMVELYSLLTSDDDKIRQRAVDQVMKFTGNDVDRLDINANVSGQIELSWGDDRPNSAHPGQTSL